MTRARLHSRYSFRFPFERDNPLQSLGDEKCLGYEKSTLQIPQSLLGIGGLYSFAGRLAERLYNFVIFSVKSVRRGP